MKIWPGEHYRTDERPAVSRDCVRGLLVALPLSLALWAAVIALIARGL